MVVDSSPHLVQAIYSFKGKNNDELCFKKGDIITVTQREEGGWWEGTLGEKTGWFPSNYVKEYKPQDGSANLVVGTISPTKSPPELASQQKMYRNVVLKDIIDSEKANVSELQSLLKNFLHPLEKSEILTRDEYRQLVGNIGHVLETHQQLLAALEDCYQRSPLEQRVGKVFLTSAPRIKQVHQAYCSSHPKAVCILDKYKDELNAFMESQEAASPGLLVLTTGLSKPFRRLEKYAGMLQELERHIEENHPDRGDTQRSVSVYKDIASACSGTRRQKELELEVLTGGVRGWEGEDLSCLGEIIHMGSVAVGPDHRDRYLVLFPSTLLILSVSQRMSAFIYEGKLPLTGINVNKLEDSDVYKNAFEITGPMIERIVAVCQTREDQTTWVDMVKRHIRVVASSPAVSPPPSKPQPLPPPHVSAPPACPYATLTAYFADLIAQGLITRSVLKRLLYNQYEKGVDLNGVKVRHSHKVECTVYPTRVSKTALTYVKSSGTSSSSNRSGTLKRQNAVDFDDSSSCGSCASNPFGFIRVFPDDHVENVNCFLDDSTDPQSADYIDSKIVNNDMESEHSKKNDSIHKPAYLSQASININCSESETRPYLKVIATLPSDESSFERSSAHQAFAYAASTCQDLAHLDDHVAEDTKHDCFTKKSTQEVRQSLPITLAPKTSNSIRSKPLVPPKPLALCAPAYRSASVKDLFTTLRGAHMNPRHQACHSVPVLSHSDDAQSTPTTLSSNLEIPTNMIRVPSAMFAELLYGQASHSNPRMTILEFLHQQESVSSDHSTRTIQSVRESTNETGAHNVPHRKSSPWECSIGDTQRLNRQTMPSNSISCRHCGTRPLEPDGISGKSSDQEYCRCCSCAPLPYSTRSSDSGLADITGNSTLPSPDLSSPLPDPGSPDTSKYCSYLPPPLCSGSNCEAQCMCTHSLGSTPRTSAQPSLTSDIIYAGSSESVPSVTSLRLDICSPWWPRDDEIFYPVSSWQFQEPSLHLSEDESICPVPCLQVAEAEHLFSECCTQSPQEELNEEPCKQVVENEPSRPEEVEEKLLKDVPHQTEKSSVHTDSQGASPEQGSPVEQRRLFRSGMYAHWWLKAKIPASALMMSPSSSPSPPPQTDVIPERPSVSQGQSTTSKLHTAN